MNGSEKSRVMENILSLSAVQGANYVLPLITLPYLVRVLGPDRYGQVAFAQALIQYFSFVTDYGFVHTAPKRVAVNRRNGEKLFEVFNSVMLIKFALMTACFFILMVLVFAVPKFHADRGLYFVTFLTVLGNALFPAWFFQGMERMKYISYLNISARLLFTMAVFFVIKSADDYLYVPLLNSIGLILAGILGLWVAARDFKVRFFFPGTKAVLEELKEGWHVFTGTFSVSFFSNSNVFILGLFANNAAVGYFKAGDSIVRAAAALIQPVVQALYPSVCRKAAISKEAARAFVGKEIKIASVFTALLSLSLFVFAGTIAGVVLGPHYENTIIVIRILALFPLVNGLSGIMGIHGLLAFGQNRAFSAIMTASAILNVALALALTPLYGHVGISTSLITTEIVAALAIFTYLAFYKKRVAA